MKFIERIENNKNLITFLFISICVIMYFLYHTFTGKYGLVSYLQQKQDLKKKTITLNITESELENKKNKVEKLRTDSIDIDLLDEKSRELLGTSKTNEIIIYDEDIEKLKNK